MADSSSMEMLQNRLRLTQLCTVDSFASDIVEVAGRTALYNYDQSGETWSKTDVEGTLMIYTRNAKPKHMITIINKNSKLNFVEAITRNCDAQLKAPYVLLRNDKMNILGIWFADQTDVPRIYQAIGKFIRIEEHENASSAANPSALSLSSQTGIAPLLPGNSNNQGTANSMDIMSMLSRAHGEFETKKSDGTDTLSATVKAKVVNAQLSQSIDLIKPSSVKLASANSTTTPIVNEDTSANCEQPPHNNTVADFFAKVGLGSPMNNNISTNKAPPHHQPSRQNTLSNSSYSSSTSNVGAASAATTTTSTTTTNNNCNANPVLQQMFQGAAAVGGQASVDNNNCIGSNPVTIPQGPRESHPQNCTPSSAGGVGSLKKVGQPAPMSLQELEGKLRENLTVSGSSGSGNQDSFIPFNDLLLGASPTSSKPALICPQMFTIGKPLIEELSPNNNSIHHKSPGVQPLLTPQEDHSMSKRVPTYNNSEVNSVPFRIIPQTPPGLATSLASPHAATASIQSLLMSNSFNAANINSNNNNIVSEAKDSFVSNNNDLRIVDSRPPGLLQQPPQQQQQAPPLLQPSHQGAAQDRQSLLLNEEQFVIALTHALTKEDFVKQLYQAYQESILLKSSKC